jgi:hypothetical protein
MISGLTAFAHGSLSDQRGVDCGAEREGAQMATRECERAIRGELPAQLRWMLLAMAAALLAPLTATADEDDPLASSDKLNNSAVVTTDPEIEESIAAIEEQMQRARAYETRGAAADARRLYGEAQRSLVSLLSSGQRLRSLMHQKYRRATTASLHSMCRYGTTWWTYSLVPSRGFRQR